MTSSSNVNFQNDELALNRGQKKVKDYTNLGSDTEKMVINHYSPKILWTELVAFQVYLLSDQTLSPVFCILQPFDFIGKCRQRILDILWLLLISRGVICNFTKIIGSAHQLWSLKIGHFIMILQ